MTLSTSAIRSLLQTQSVSDDDISTLLPYAKEQFTVESGIDYDDGDSKHNLAVMYIIGTMFFPNEASFVERYKMVISDLIEDTQGKTYHGFVHHEGETTW